MERTRSLKRFLTSIIAVIFSLGLFIYVSPTVGGQADIPDETVKMLEETMVTEESIPSKTIEEIIQESFRDLEYIEPTDKDSALSNIENCEIYMYELRETSDAYSIISEEINVIIAQEIKRVNNIRLEYQADYNNFIKIEEEKLYWETKSAEYPIATEIWLYMKNELGWNDYVCAGVMGNIMVETGGQTLYIKQYLYDPSGYYYGICQWNASAYGAVHNTDLQYQLQFLRDTVQYEMNTYGYAYKNGFNYESFVNLQSAEAAALAFAKCYERCHSGSYGIRQSSALKAYQYFVG